MQDNTNTTNLIEWRDIPGYEGLYAVSNFGEVKSLDRIITQFGHQGRVTKRRWPERILAQTTDNGVYAYGRKQVKLSKNGYAKTHLVHRLVAAAFLGPCPSGMEVAHFDGNAGNNQLHNLRYATAAENTWDKFRHGTVVRGARVANAKLDEEKVKKIKRCNGTVYEIADQFGISIAQVSRIRNGKRWGHVK